MPEQLLFFVSQICSGLALEGVWIKILIVNWYYSTQLNFPINTDIYLFIYIHRILWFRWVVCKLTYYIPIITWKWESTSLKFERELPLCFTREKVILSIVHPQWGLWVTSAILSAKASWLPTRADWRCGRLLSWTNCCSAGCCPGPTIPQQMYG